MPRMFAACLFLTFSLLRAQTPSSGPAFGHSEHSELDRIQQELIFDPDAYKKAVALRQAADVQEFYARARKFLGLWDEFAADLNNDTTLNAKRAKKAAKAFHDLEKSAGWLVGRSK